MELLLQRISHDARSTVGELYIDGQKQCFVLEDQPQEKKIAGETRIPAGRYRLELKPVGASRFDRSMKKTMGEGHKGMVRLRDVPGFTEILIHCGNFHTDTEGCLLVGDKRGFADGTNAVWRSKVAYKAIYPIIADAIGCEEVWLTIGDEAS